jgi:hypothetical protein
VGDVGPDLQDVRLAADVRWIGWLGISANVAP